MNPHFPSVKAAPGRETLHCILFFDSGAEQADKAPRPLADPVGYLEAVQFRHGDVQNDQVRKRLLKGLRLMVALRGFAGTA